MSLVKPDTCSRPSTSAGHLCLRLEGGEEILFSTKSRVLVHTQCILESFMNHHKSKTARRFHEARSTFRSLTMTRECGKPRYKPATHAHSHTGTWSWAAVTIHASTATTGTAWGSALLPAPPIPGMLLSHRSSTLSSYPSSQGGSGEELGAGRLTLSVDRAYHGLYLSLQGVTKNCVSHALYLCS